MVSERFAACDRPQSSLVRSVQPMQASGRGVKTDLHIQASEET